MPKIGPGPAAYMLPTAVGYDKHTAIKDRRPQYSFGTRAGLKQRSLGPGPAAYNPDKFTRYGRSRDPAYSLSFRTGVPNRNIGPGAAGYNIGGKSLGPRAPQYSMSGRTTGQKPDKVPGPNTYMYKLNSVKPGIPAYSMGLRTVAPYDKMPSPGPAAYGAPVLNVNKNRNPMYSMSGRTTVIDKRVSPGSNTYNLAEHKPGDSAPKYTFGVRHGPDAPPMIVQCDN